MDLLQCGGLSLHVPERDTDRCLCAQALNDLFEKILLRDVPARYLLRLGMGEQELATTLDFSRVGRVNAMLARRLELLAEVGAES